MHATPERTEELRASVEQQATELDEADAQTAQLADAERSLRRSTRSQRYVLMGVAAAVLIIVILIFVFACSAQA